MGVYHFSGLGLSPGAVTVPISSVYVYLSASVLGDEEASQFFALSGETQNGHGSRESIKGNIEGIVLFTSEDVVECKNKGKITNSHGAPITKWFNTPFTNRCVKTVVKKYIKLLIDHLNDNVIDGFATLPYPRIYLIKVNYEDFKKVLEIALKTYIALRRKEVWVSMVGGSNQINSALLVGGTLTAVPSRYYYIFQNPKNLSKLDPDFIDTKPKRDNMGSISKKVEDNIHELPLFSFEMSSFLTALSQQLSGDNKINKQHLSSMLKRYNLTDKYIPKLIGARLIVNKDNETFEMGPNLKIMNSWLNEQYNSSENLSNWKKRFQEEWILEVLEID